MLKAGERLRSGSARMKVNQRKLVFKAFNDLGPGYLEDHLLLYQPLIMPSETLPP